MEQAADTLTGSISNRPFRVGHGGLAPWLSNSTVPDQCVPVDEPEWREWTSQVCRQGLAGLVLAHARARGGALPDAVGAALHDSASLVAAENTHAFRKLEQVLCAFNRRAVPVMLLKGAALNLSIYPSPDLRPMSDLDLMVRPCDARTALGLLDDFGCVRGFSLIRDDFFPRYHYEVEVFVPGPRPVRIDLHARPFRPLRLARVIPDEGFWVGAREIRVGSGAALAPRVESEFIHLAAHAAFHGCSRLLWLYDIKRYVEAMGEAMDWGLVVQRCEEWRLSLAVREALAKATTVFGEFVPRSVGDELARHRDHWRDRWTLRHAPHDAASPIGHVLVNMLCTPGIRFRLGYLAALLLPNRAHLEGIYRYRHRGWPICAQVWRMARAIGRAAALPLRGLTLLPAR